MKKLFTLVASALMASAAWAGVVTLDLNKTINPESLGFDANGIWTECYNDVDYTWLEFGDADGTFMLSHLIDGEGASWGGYYWDGFCPAIGGDQTDYGQPGSSGTWTVNFGGCMAGGGCTLVDGKVVADPNEPYLVAYYSSWAMEGPSNQVMFVDKEGNTTFEPVGVYVCNHPWPYYGCLHGDGFGRAFEEGDYFELTAHGVAADGTETTTSINLVEFVDGQLNALNDWTFFDLSSLGEVESVYFTLTSTDSGAYGMNTAAYFCMDDFQVKGEEDVPPTPPTPEGIVPANPTADDWYDCGGEYGFSKFYFTLPAEDVNGNDLDAENLSYAVWINDGFGEVYQFTFPAEDYIYDLDEDINEVPYDLYTSAVDFRSNYVYMYRTNENDNPLFVRDEEHNGNIGIQVFYTSEDRAKTASDIVWLYEDETPEPPTPTESVVLVIVDQDGHEHMFELAKGDNGDFTTTVAMTYVPYGQEYWDPNLTDEENELNRPIAPFYFIINGERYGAEGMRPTVLGLALENPLDNEADGFYTIPVGYNYTLGVAVNENEYYVYAAVASFTGVDELNANKPVSGVRYFNMAGQEMAQPSGLTIVVTTYTDGTTSAVKVIK